MVMRRGRKKNEDYMMEDNGNKYKRPTDLDQFPEKLQ